MNKSEISLKKDLSEKELDSMHKNHQYWESNSDKFHDSHEVSWGDVNMMNLEIETVSEYLPDTGRILDVGCSNGFSTLSIADKKSGLTINGFDYSEKAIQTAHKNLENSPHKDRIQFQTGNALNIDFEDNTFDAAYNIRVIINLPSWEAQQDTIKEVCRVLKPGGVYVFSEAFYGSLANLNALRALNNMKPLTVHEFNLYLYEDKFEAFAKEHFEIVAVRKFSSIYYVASRFLRYLTMKDGEKDSFKNDINDFFSKYRETENSGDFGIQKIYVLKKK